jgi:hypothetical protein
MATILYFPTKQVAQKQEMLSVRAWLENNAAMALPVSCANDADAYSAAANSLVQACASFSSRQG